MTRRIAYLTLQATREGQAAHAHVNEIVNGLRELGWSVTLFEPEYGPDASPGILARLLEFRRIQRNLISRLRDFDAVYIRAHFLALPTARSVRAAHIPVIQECNGPYEDLYAAWPAARPGRVVFNSWQRSQFRNANAVIAVTPELAAWVDRETGRQDTRIVGNGANTDLFRPGLETVAGTPTRYAVFVGALSAWQGVTTMLAATEESAWPEDVPLVIAGDGALRADVEAAAAGGRVRYLGAIPYADAARLVSNALTALVMKDSAQHARSGLSPVKLYESMAAGVPIVVSDMPGLSEIARSCECGLIVPAGDATALALAVARLAEDPHARTRMGEAGRAAAVTGHSWRAAARKVAEIIDSIILTADDPNDRALR